MKVRVHVRLKAGVLDPQGLAIKNALATLGFTGVQDVRQGKLIELELEADDAAAAKAMAEEMCRQLLVNGVMETSSVEVAT